MIMHMITSTPRRRVGFWELPAFQDLSAPVFSMVPESGLHVEDWFPLASQTRSLAFQRCDRAFDDGEVEA